MENSPRGYPRGCASGCGFPIRRFPAKELSCVETRVQCPLVLSDFSQNWNVSTNFSKKHQNQILWKSVHSFSSRFMRADRHDKASRSILATLFSNTPKSKVQHLVWIYRPRRIVRDWNNIVREQVLEVGRDGVPFLFEKPRNHPFAF
jgi:hypothetical protein